MVAMPISEAHDFVFDARAISRPCRLDLAVVHRSAVEIRADERVRFFAGRREKTRPLLLLRKPARGHRERREIGKRHRVRIARLQFEPVKIDRLRREPRRSARLQSTQFKPQFLQRPAHAHRRRLAHAPALSLALAGVHQPAHERARRQHHRPRRERHQLTHFPKPAIEALAV